LSEGKPKLQMNYERHASELCVNRSFSDCYTVSRILIMTRWSGHLQVTSPPSAVGSSYSESAVFSP